MFTAVLDFAQIRELLGLFILAGLEVQSFQARSQGVR